MFGFIDFQLKCSISLYHGQRQPSTMGRRQFCDCHQQQSLVFLSHITVPCRALGMSLSFSLASQAHRLRPAPGFGYSLC